MSARPPAVLRRHQPRPCLRSHPCPLIQLQPETVRQACKVVEDAHDVPDLQARLVIEAKVAERLPICLRHPRRRRAELVGHRAKGVLARRDPRDGTPRPRLDRLHKFRAGIFEAQKLCVRLGSVMAILGGGGHTRNHLPFRASQRAGRKHDLLEQRSKGRANPRVRGEESSHRRHEIHLVPPRRWRSSPGWRDMNPCFRYCLLRHARSLPRSPPLAYPFSRPVLHRRRQPLRRESTVAEPGERFDPPSPPRPGRSATRPNASNRDRRG